MSHNIAILKRKRSILAKLRNLYSWYNFKPLSRTADTIHIILPIEYTYILLKNSNILLLYIYNNLYSFIFSIDSTKLTSLKYYNCTNTICIIYSTKFLFFKLGKAHLLELLHLLYSMYIIKLRIRGRLFRLYKHKYFGVHLLSKRSHIVIIYVDSIYFKYIKKFSRIRIFGFSKCTLANKANEIASWSMYNIYTSRGLFVENRLVNIRPAAGLQLF
jgi:hypothetical protein